MERWVEHSPVNFSHCVLLIKAEQFRTEGKTTEAHDTYRAAIAAARQNQYIAHEGIAHELLGKLMIQLGKKSPARYCILDAIRCYQDWGASVKVQKLEIQYTALLSSQLHEQKDQKASVTLKGSSAGSEVS